MMIVNQFFSCNQFVPKKEVIERLFYFTLGKIYSVNFVNLNRLVNDSIDEGEEENRFSVFCLNKENRLCDWALVRMRARPTQSLRYVGPASTLRRYRLRQNGGG